MKGNDMGMNLKCCTYCPGKNCGLSQMLDCKLKMNIDSVKNLESKVEELYKSEFENDQKISKLQDVIHPILNMDLSTATKDDMINAIMNVRILYGKYYYEECR